MFKYLFKIILYLLLKVLFYINNNIHYYSTIFVRIFGFGVISKIIYHLCDSDKAVIIINMYGGNIGKNVRINSPLNLLNANGSYNNLIIGDDSHIGSDVMIDLADKIEIGKRVTISMRSTIITHFDVGDSNLSKRYQRHTGKVVIEDNVYIGCGATILHGVTVKNSSIVAAGAIVRDDVPQSVVVGGIPAKVIKNIDV